MPTWQLDDLGENGRTTIVSDESALRTFLESLSAKQPRIVMVDLNANEQLIIGIGGQWAFVERVKFEPWKAEVVVADRAKKPEMKPSSQRFQADGACDTEIPSKFLIPVSDMIDIVASIFASGNANNSVRWELV